MGNIDEKKWGVATGVSLGIVLIVALMVGSEKYRQGQYEKSLEINTQNPNALAENTWNIKIPLQLVSNADDVLIDITNPADVAAAMGIELSGKKDQVLFGVEINGRTLPVTAEMLPQIANVLNTLENALVSPDGKKSIAPENFHNEHDNKTITPAR